MTPPTNLSELVYKFIDVIDVAIPVVIGLALLAFFWGLAKFIFRVGGDEKAVADGKKLMVWGIIALFILISFVAIIEFFYNDLEFSDSFGLPTLPPL